MRSSFCDGIDRRGFLRLGSVAGLSLAEILRLQAAQGASGPTPPFPPFERGGKGGSRDVNCIFIFILGGMPHHDM